MALLFQSGAHLGPRRVEDTSESPLGRYNFQQLGANYIEKRVPLETVGAKVAFN